MNIRLKRFALALFAALLVAGVLAAPAIAGPARPPTSYAAPAHPRRTIPVRCRYLGHEGPCRDLSVGYYPGTSQCPCAHLWVAAVWPRHHATTAIEMLDGRTVGPVRMHVGLKRGLVTVPLAHNHSDAGIHTLVLRIGGMRTAPIRLHYAAPPAPPAPLPAAPTLISIDGGTTVPWTTHEITVRGTGLAADGPGSMWSMTGTADPHATPGMLPSRMYDADQVTVTSAVVRFADSPLTPGTYTITYSNPGGSTSLTFTVPIPTWAPPSLTAIEGTTGTNHDVVAPGTSTLFVDGTALTGSENRWLIDGQPATVAVISATQAKVTVPGGATAGTHDIALQGGSSLTFRVMGEAATMTAIEGGSTVTITGDPNNMPASWEPVVVDGTSLTAGDLTWTVDGTTVTGVRFPCSDGTCAAPVTRWYVSALDAGDHVITITDGFGRTASITYTVVRN